MSNMGFIDLSSYYSDEEIDRQIRKLVSVYLLDGRNIVTQSNEDYLSSLLTASYIEIKNMVRETIRQYDLETAPCDFIMDQAYKLGIENPHNNGVTGIVKLSGQCGAIFPLNLKIMVKNKSFTLIDAFPKDSSGNPILTPNGEAYGFIYSDEELRPDAFENGKDSLKGEIDEEVKFLDKEVEVLGNLCFSKSIDECEYTRRRLLEIRRIDYSFKEYVTQALLKIPCLTNVLFIENQNCCPLSVNNERKIEDFMKRMGNDNLPCLYFFPLFENSFEGGVFPDEMENYLDTYLNGKIKAEGLGKLPYNFCAVPLRLNIIPINIEVKSQIMNAGLRNRIKQFLEEKFNLFENGPIIDTYELNSVLRNNFKELQEVCIILRIDKKYEDFYMEDRQGGYSFFCDTKVILKDINFINFSGFKNG